MLLLRQLAFYMQSCLLFPRNCVFVYDGLHDVAVEQTQTIWAESPSERPTKGGVKGATAGCCSTAYEFNHFICRLMNSYVLFKY